MGTTSTDKFGLPIPFKYKVRKIFYSCSFSTGTPSISITLINHSLINDNASSINSSEINLSSSVSPTGMIHEFVDPSDNFAGNLSIRIDGVADLYEDCKFRISILYSTEDTFEDTLL